MEPENLRQPKEPRVRRLPRLHLRARVRGVRPWQDARQALQLHLPVPAGHQEADEEVRRQRSPLRLHQPEPVPEVLHRQRNNKGVDHLLDIRDQGKDQKSHLKAATPLEHKGAKVNSLRLTTKCKRFIFLAKNETGLLALKSRQIHQGFLGQNNKPCLVFVK